MIVRNAVTDDLNQLTLLFDSYRQFYLKPGDVIAAKKFLSEPFPPR